MKSLGVRKEYSQKKKKGKNILGNSKRAMLKQRMYILTPANWAIKQRVCRGKHRKGKNY